MVREELKLPKLKHPRHAVTHPHYTRQLPTQRR